MTTPVAGGWIPHDGGPNPAPGKLVECNRRDLAHAEPWGPSRSEDCRWSHKDWGTDIIAYRIVDVPALTDGEGELEQLSLTAALVVLSSADDMSVFTGDGEANVGLAARKAAAWIADLEAQASAYKEAARYVLGLLPIGADDKPDNHVIAFYINMGELRAARALLNGAESMAPNTDAIKSLRSDIEALSDALRLILPLAKGYSPSGQTATARATCNSWIETAETLLNGADR